MNIELDNEKGKCSFEDIDTAAMNGLGYPMRPFSLLEFDRDRFSYHVGMENTKNLATLPTDHRQQLLRNTPKENGKKVGKGFYDYE